MGFLHFIGLVLLCIASDDNGVLSLICGERICGYGTLEHVCNIDNIDTCICKHGFDRIPPSATYPDVDICLEDCGLLYPCSTKESCGRSLHTGGVCKCIEGYSRSFTGECIDIKECEEANNCMDHSAYKTTTGRNECLCIKGFEWDGRACRPKDIKECEQANNCMDHSVCKHTIGRNEFLRIKGFEWDGNACRRKVLSLICGERICGYGTQEDDCSIDGCRCKDGFKKIATSTMYPDVDTCLETCDLLDPCSSIESCGRSLFGSGLCKCEEGYYRSFTGECIDSKECEESNICMDHSTCKITTGRNECLCINGFEWDGRACRATDIKNCECLCINGFEWDARACVPKGSREAYIAGSNAATSVWKMGDESTERTDSNDGSTIGQNVGVMFGVTFISLCY